MKIAFAHNNCENLGIQCLSAFLKINGHETMLAFDPQILDDEYFLNVPILKSIFNSEKEVVNKVKKYNAPIVGFSVFTTNYIWASSMAKKIKERHGATPFGFRFTTRQRRNDELDSKVVKTSCMYYLGGKVLTLDDIKKRNDPDDRILIKDQADASENGIYDVTAGAPTRSPDFDTGSEVFDGAMVSVN